MSKSTFQFTHPGRGATSALCVLVKMRYSFNSRTPGGVRLLISLISLLCSEVSIHAPREGCDRSAPYKSCYLYGFNSRTPGGVRQYGAKLPIMGRINKRNLRLAVLL